MNVPRSAHPAAPAARACTYIKICGLTREQDVDAAVAAGADAVGFVLYPKSPRCVTAERADLLARRLPPLVTPVLLFVNAEAGDVKRACAPIPRAIIQFHGDESPADCVAIAASVGHAFWRAARLPLSDTSNPSDLLKFAAAYGNAQAILLDAHTAGYGGGGQAFDWSALPLSVPAHLILSGGLTPSNVGKGIAAVRGRGRSLTVDVSSGVEAVDSSGKPRKGVKDAARMQRFVAAVRAADASRS